MPATTYPQTGTPLRGLAAFTESERDVFYGRDGERDELAKLITGDGFRAGLLYGEAGVGKTSLLRAGLIPHLRDHGVIVLPCDDLSDPARSFAEAAHAVTGQNPSEGEQPLNYLARIVSQAIEGQLYLFVLDDVDYLLGLNDQRINAQLGDLFARVVTRSRGRARFLFSCCSARVHRFGALEKRTGSLFPPASRFELRRFDPPTAAHVLERTLSLAGLTSDRTLADAVVDQLAAAGPILPADLQIAALAIRALRIATVDDLRAAGGATELERQWIGHVAATTGNERAALRLLAELATGDEAPPQPPDWAAARAGIDREFARRAAAAFAEHGLLYVVRGADGAHHYRLAHELLAGRIREIAAPARAAARRAYELLGSKAAQHRRLSLREWWQVRREGIAPSTPEELAVLHRTRRFFRAAAAVAVGVPLAALVTIWLALAGNYYLGAAPTRDGRTERVVVRKGSPGLSAFFWLPASPRYGSIVADPGVTRAMIAADRWPEIADGDVVGDLGGTGYADAVLERLDPIERALWSYAATGDAVHLAPLSASDLSDDDRIAVLDALRPIARGGSQEVSLVKQALASDNPAVQTAALALATAAAARLPDAYRDVLADAAASADAHIRHLAFSAARSLGDEAAHAIFQLALAADPQSAARAELLAALATDTADAADADAAVRILADPDAVARHRKRAAELLRRAFRTDPESASRAAIALVSDHRAPTDHRLLALELLDEYAPKSVYGELAGPLRLATRSDDEAIKTAAWPLFARVNPQDAAVELVSLTEGLAGLSPAMRQAIALGWGELARTKEPAAGPSLKPLLEDDSPAVRAAAARAYGFVGRRAQNELYELIKKDRFDVAVGAAYGLANSVEVGGSTSAAVGGIAQLWKKKGRARRVAAEVYAQVARTKPSAVFTYLVSAARGKDDAALKPIGVRGLCNALAAGSRSAARELRRATRDPSIDVRRLIADCAVAHVNAHPRQVDDLAIALAGDSDPVIRADAARALAALARRKATRDRAAKALVGLATDDDRGVRILAVRGLAALGRDAPDRAAAALQRAFERADAAEKLELLSAASAIGATGLVPVALADASASVRVAGVRAALAAGGDAAGAIHAALGDPEASVRRAALAAIAAGSDALGQDAVDDALALATRDPDPTIAALALETLARVGPIDAVRTRLARDLAAPSEAVRARAAAASEGLVARDPQAVVALLEPALDDPARDVRAAALSPLAMAYAASQSVDALASRLVAGEAHATRRLVAAAALFLANGDDGASRAALDKVAAEGPPLARRTAGLVLGLIDGRADGVAFLASRVR
ncbi:MAG: NACHT domain-containing protein [Deltaproteobacteria bacterium]|nr:MAG: NACHT domain-containing protein [Deltaproteobacteria bacterium]